MDSLPNISNSDEHLEPIGSDLDLDLVSEPSPRSRKKMPSTLGKRLRLIGRVLQFITLCGVVFFVTILCLFKFYGDDKTRALLGMPPIVKTDVHKKAIEELQANSKLLADQIQEIGTHVGTLDQTTRESNSNLKHLKERFDELNKQIAHSKKQIADLQAALKKRPKTVAATKSTTVAHIPVAAPMKLLSVRIQGGLDIVTLQSPGGDSHLLMVGDTWKGWRLIKADPAQLRASFRVNGRVRELTL